MTLLRSRSLISLELSLLLVAGSALIGCGSDDDGNGTGDDAADSGGATAGTAGGEIPEGCDQYVEVSDDDQAALQGAFIEVPDDGVVCLAEGNFAFTRQLTLDTPGVTVRGAGADLTILDFIDQASGGNGLLITGDNTTIEELTVKNTPGDGIRADQVENISFLQMRVEWDAEASLDNGAYGLYPVQCTNVLIQNTVVVGARDAGIYVGQSNGILVEDSEAYGNVAGIEVENSVDADVRRNEAHDNTAGVLVFNLPGLDIKDGRRTNVYDNNIYDNNIDNFAEAGTIVAMVPPGLGVLILSTDQTEVADNTITGNRTAGLGLIAYIPGLFGAPNDDEFDIYSQGTWIHDNAFSNNATDPDELLLTITGGPMSYDIVFGGCVDPNLDPDPALDNCISNNGEATFLLGDACSQNSGVSTDATSSTCEQPALPRQQ